MIYMTALDGTICIVLEDGNLDRLREGKPAVTPDKKVMICYTPNMVWLADRLQDSDGSGEVVAALLEESLKQPRKTDGVRPYHKPHVHHFGNGPGEAPPG